MTAIIAMTTRLIVTPAVAPISLEQLQGYLAMSCAEQNPDNVKKFMNQTLFKEKLTYNIMYSHIDVLTENLI